MKVLAEDLQHGQRFRVEGNEYMASGSIDQNGACVCLDRLNRLAWIDGDNEVELIDPPAEPADCVVVGAGDSRVVEPAIDPGPGYRLLRKGELVQEGDDVYMDDEYGWESSSNDGCPQGKGFSYRRRIEPTYRPYTDAELVDQLGAKVRLKDSVGLVGYLVAVVDSGIAIINNRVIESHVLLAEYEHLDGTPCGVKE